MATVLQVEEQPARQYISYLRQLGLIDSQNKPTQLAEDWRHDENYADVCRRILEATYPRELIDIAPPPSPSRERVTQYIMRRYKLGEGAAKNKAAQYMLLAAGVNGPPQERAAKVSNNTNVKQIPKHKAAPSGQRAPKQELKNGNTSPEIQLNDPPSAKHALARQAAFETSPSLHINIQIHISLDSTSEQIETIFKQMSLHLGLKNGSV